MRQLGHHRLEHEPGRHEPGQQKLCAGLAARPPDHRRRQPREHRSRPERDPEQHEIESGRCAMRLLPARHLAEHVVADRLHEEIAARFGDDGDEPRQDQQDHPGETGDRTQRPQPARGAVGNRQRDCSKHDEHQDQRPLEKGAGGQRRPEYGRLCPTNRGFGRAPASEIDPRHRAHRRDGRSAKAWRPSWRAAPRRRAGPSLPSSAPRSVRHVLKRTQAPPSRSAARRRSHRRATAGDRARSSRAAAARRALLRFSPRLPAASRCRPASCSGPRSGTGCRHTRRFPASASSPARSAPRRDRPAGSGKSPAGRPAVRTTEAARRRVYAKPPHSRALCQGRGPEQAMGRPYSS